MSLDFNKEEKENKNGEEIKNDKEKNSQPEDNNDNDNDNNKYSTTEANLNIKPNLKEKDENTNNKNIKKGKNNIDNSTLILFDKNSQEKNDGLNQLNNQVEQNKNTDTNNQSFIQRTKSWMSNMWVNIKNYNYGKYNIFKRTEMEDCLDAHGNHIKIPKNRSNKKLEKKNEDYDEDFKKYNNLNYDRYFSATNVNAFSGYPF